MPGFHFCRTIRRHYGAILVGAVVATAVGGYLTSRLRLESDLSELLPSSFPSVQALHRMREEGAGGSSRLRVVMASSDFSALKRMAADLAPKLEASKYVAYTQYRNDVGFFQTNALLFLSVSELDSLHDAVRSAIDDKKQELNPFMVNDLFGADEGEAKDNGLEVWEKKYEAYQPKPYYTNNDSTVLVMEVFPSEESVDIAFSRAMLADVQRIVESVDPTSYAPDVRVLYGSNIKNRIDEFETLKRDIFGTAVYGVTGVFILLILYFRSLVAPLLIALSLAASLMWTFGVAYLAIGQLNTITGFLFVVLFGMGIDYGIHAFARYRESRQAGLDRDQGLHHMVCDTGRALATTTLTTAAAFFSLMLMDFRGFSELGFITALGLIFALVAMVVVLPSLIVVTDKLGLLRIPRVPERSLSFERRPFRPARILLIVGGLVTAVAAWGFTGVGFQYDFTELRIITKEREQVGRLTSGVFTKSESPAVVMADSREEAEMVEAAVKEHMRTDTLTPTVDRVSSVYSFVPQHQEARLQRIRDIRTLIEEENARALLTGNDLDRLERLEGYLAVDRPVTFDDIPPAEIRPFLNRKGEVGSFVFIYPSVPLRDGRNSIRFAEDIGAISLPDGKVVHAASPNIIIADLLRMVIREGRLAVGLSLAIVFLLLVWDFRGFKPALLVMIPLGVGVIWMGGVMSVMGMKLNLFNMVVLPSVIGVGVDAGVHMYHRYREEGPGSLYQVLRRTGPAVGMATITTIVGYTGLILASHPGLVSIGELAVVALTTTLVSALTLLPAMIQTVDSEVEIPAASPEGGHD